MSFFLFSTSTFGCEPSPLSPYRREVGAHLQRDLQLLAACRQFLGACSHPRRQPAPRPASRTRRVRPPCPRPYPYTRTRSGRCAPAPPGPGNVPHMLANSPCPPVRTMSNTRSSEIPRSASRSSASLPSACIPSPVFIACAGPHTHHTASRSLRCGLPP